MKQLIRKILREQEEEIITLPPFSFFAYDWNEVLEYADGKLFRMNGDIDLNNTDIITLGGLVEVGGDLDLWNCKNIQSLGKLESVGGNLDLFYCENLKSLGKLISVGNFLDLRFCKNLQSLGELRSVGSDLYLYNSLIAQTMTEDEIRAKVDVGGSLFMV